MHQKVWQTWAGNIRKWGLEDIVASLLEASGPLTILGAQLAYIGQPLLTSFFHERYFSALVDLLENPEQSQLFIGYLREGASQ